MPNMSPKSKRLTKKKPGKPSKVGKKRKREKDTDVKSKKRKECISTASVPSGKVFVLGQGELGQLGLGEDIPERGRPTPVKQLLEDDFIQVSCGGVHTAALSKIGKVHTWGCNDEYALGRDIADGSDGEYIPGLVEGLDGIKIVQISAGDNHTAALTDDGRVYHWGNFWDNRGSLGLNMSGKQSKPTIALDGSDSVVKIGSGNNHVAALSASGHIFTWGCGDQGQLGRIGERFCSRETRKGFRPFLQPAVARFVKNTWKKVTFVDIFVGSYNIFGLSTTGDVYACGLNNYGQVGTGNNTNLYYLERINNLSNLSAQTGDKKFSIACGEHHTLVLTSAGRVYSIGRSDYGRLGLGSEASECSVPTEIEYLQDLNIAAISCGLAVSFALTSAHDIYSWGMGTNLQLGNGEENDIAEPTLIQLKQNEIIGVSAGGQHTAMLSRKRPTEA